MNEDSEFYLSRKEDGCTPAPFYDGRRRFLFCFDTQMLETHALDLWPAQTAQLPYTVESTFSDNTIPCIAQPYLPFASYFSPSTRFRATENHALPITDILYPPKPFGGHHPSTQKRHACSEQIPSPLDGPRIYEVSFRGQRLVPRVFCVLPHVIFLICTWYTFTGTKTPNPGISQARWDVSSSDYFWMPSSEPPAAP